MKERIANLLYLFGVLQLFFYFTLRKTKIRVVNYHCTPSDFTINFELQLKFYSKYFTSVSEDDLDQYFKTKKWCKNKPGLIISFDDGLRSNYDFALPLLEKYNFIGWFFIPVEFVSQNTKEFASKNSITTKQDYFDCRYSMNMKELREISNIHVIGIHTTSHHRFTESDSQNKLEEEIVLSKAQLEQMIEKEINSFCWVGGELKHYTKRANELIKLHYNFSFLTNNKPISDKTNRHLIDRTNIESDYSLPLITFQLSGLMDLYYKKKRRLLNKILK